MKTAKSLKSLNTGVGNSVSYGGTKIPLKIDKNPYQLGPTVGNTRYNKNKHLDVANPTFPTLSYTKSYARDMGVGNVGYLYKVSYVPTPRRF